MAEAVALNRRDDCFEDPALLASGEPPPSIFFEVNLKKRKANLSRALAISYIRQTMTFLSEGEVPQHVRVELDTSGRSIRVSLYGCIQQSNKSDLDQTKG